MLPKCYQVGLLCIWRKKRRALKSNHHFVQPGLRIQDWHFKIWEAKWNWKFPPIGLFSPLVITLQPHAGVSTTQFATKFSQAHNQGIFSHPQICKLIPGWNLPLWRAVRSSKSLCSSMLAARPLHVAVGNVCILVAPKFDFPPLKKFISTIPGCVSCKIQIKSYILSNIYIRSFRFVYDIIVGVATKYFISSWEGLVYFEKLGFKSWPLTMTLKPTLWSFMLCKLRPQSGLPSTWSESTLAMTATWPASNDRLTKINNTIQQCRKPFLCWLCPLGNQVCQPRN